MSKAGYLHWSYDPFEKNGHFSTKPPNYVCPGCTCAETERIWECEDALSATENTRQLVKLLWMSKGVTGSLWIISVNSK